MKTELKTGFSSLKQFGERTIALLEPFLEAFDGFTDSAMQEFRQMNEKIDKLEAENKAYHEKLFSLVTSIDSQLKNKEITTEAYLNSLV